MRISKEKKELMEKYKGLPITWGKGNPSIGDMVGIWKDSDITLEEIRKRAWER